VSLLRAAVNAPTGLLMPFPTMLASDRID
jgi:hypothetical protein